MGRHALRRGGLAATVTTLAVAVAAASVTVLTGTGGPARAAGAQSAAGTSEITLTDPASAQPRFDQPFAAGPGGFLHGQSGIAGLLWTSHADGTTVSVRTPDGLFTPTGPCSTFGSTCQQAWYGSDGDLVALPTSTSSTTVTLWDPATRRTSTVTSAYPYRALAGNTVLTSRTLIDTVDGERRERPFSPAEVTVNNGYVMAADAAGVLVRWGTSLYYIDIESAVVTKAFSNVSATVPVVLSEGRIGYYGDGGLHVKPRTDPGGDEEFVALPGPYQFAKPVLTGDWLLLPPQTGAGTSTAGLTALSLVDGSSRTLLDKAGKSAVHGPGDTALVTGGTSAADWWVQRVSLAADGTPKLTKLYQVPAPENAKTGIALSRGSLRLAQADPADANGFDTTSVRTLTTDGGTVLTASPATGRTKIRPKCPYPGTTCSALWGNTVTSPQDVYLEGASDVYEDGPVPGSDRLVPIGYHSMGFNTTGGSIVDVSDDYAVYDSGGSAPAQYVGRFGHGQLLKRSVQAAALNGPVLWSAAGAGRVTSYSLTEKKTLTTVTVPGLGCVPGELQAAGRWLYWSCGTASAGVYDTKAGTSRAVTPGDVLLGDGFTVRHDHAAGTLVLTDAATGATRVLASEVPDTGLAADRRYRWTVDEYTGLVAWFDLHERTHVATTGFAPSAPAAFLTDAATQANLKTSTPWTGTWLLSRPVTSWSLTFTSVESGETGKATRTLTGGAATARVTAPWDGRTAGGVPFPNGQFKWSLKATGLGTSTAVAIGGGSGTLTAGSPVRHDYGGPDGIGDLLTMNSTGSLTIHLGTAKGTLSTKVTGTGWPKGTTVVPFGDLSGDRCNDVVVRPGNGSLRLYKPKCGAALKASTPYTTLGTSGWNQYDVMVSTGDITGDGRPDLVVRKASTGDMYLYKGTGAGKLSARVKIASNWKTYKRIVAVGDITGDGIGDLIAQDKSNNLYRYNGTRTGAFKARVKIATKWGASYNACVGVGDLNRDGIGDLICRDTSGKLFRHYGSAKGGFGARTQIGTGWGGYKALY
ncbi:FG-GAP repeat domain-containing protein [Streptomyces sp. NPDC091412]|uniref:FG-GAP repeat domain-containing protein n=1 Tax=Streptomyces sp. NPDC091412 TaxID=3366002 RepID=UPI00380C0DE1